MFKQMIWRLLLFALLFVLSVSSIQAQIELDANYTSPDGSFSFHYPDHGQAILDDESYVGSVQISIPLYGQDYNINVFSPWLTQIQIDGVQSLEAAQGVLQDRMATEETVFEINTFQAHQMLEFLDETKGYWVLIELDNGSFGLIGVHAEQQRRSRLRELARMIARSYSYHYPVIETYAGTWQDIIAELQNKAIIAERGSLVFSDTTHYTDWGQNLIFDAYDAHINLVMSAQITVSGNASCGLMAHWQSLIDNAEDVYSLTVLLNARAARSGIGFSDNFGVVSRAFEFIHMPIEAGTTHHYLLITDDHKLSIYVDGKPLLEDAPIAPVEGYYGLYFNAISADSACHVDNLWVYEHDVPVTQETCQAVVLEEAEGRLWPAQERVIRTFVEGDSFSVTCHNTLDTGETWYLLRNGLWVEASKVHLSGDCAELTIIH
jgi:hypothetical protein